jgi:hypothetical protein
MPVAFLYNRRAESDADPSLVTALEGSGYQLMGACVPLHLLLKDCAPGNASSVGILAGNVEEDTTVATRTTLLKVEDLHAVLGIALRAHLPETVGTLDVVKVAWASEARSVFDCLLQCASFHGDGGSSTRKKHAGAAQGILQRELRALEVTGARGFWGAPPLQQVTDFILQASAVQDWREVCEWMTDPFAESRLLYPVTPPWTQNLELLFPVLRCGLKNHLLKRLRECHIQYVRSARLLSAGSSPEISRVLLSVDRHGLPDNANPKHSLVYVCALHDMYAMLEQEEDFDLERIGTLHFVLGHSPDLRRLRLRPVVPLAEGTCMLVAVLEAAHDVFFAYECLRTSALRRSLSDESGFLALRAWCGCDSSTTNSLSHFFGPPGQRHLQITYAERRLGKTFSQEQWDILNTLEGDFSAIACVAGAGKTLLLLALLAMAHREIVELGRQDLCVTYVAPTQELTKRTIEEFRQCLCEGAGLTAVWAFGFDRMRFVDLLKEQVATALADRTPVVAVADSLSATIDIVWETYVQIRERCTDKGERDECHQGCRTLCLWLLAVQHSFLDVIYYTVAHSYQDKLFDLMRIRFCTVDYLLKMQAGFLGDDLKQQAIRHLLLCDEFAEMPNYKVAGVLTEKVDCLVAAGDPYQNVTDVAKHQNSNDDQLSSNWMEKCRRVHWHRFNTSRRIAPPLSRYIGRMFPLLPAFTSSRQFGERTLLLPVWFSVHDYNWERDTKCEIGHEAACFTHMLFLLCLELLAGVQHESMSIVIICLLNHVARDVTAFLRWALPLAMEELRAQLQLPPYPDKYDAFRFDTLVSLNCLRVVGPVLVRGFTFKVAFWLGLRRRTDDDTWAGLILSWNILYVHFTRASDRLYMFMEDLRPGVRLPSRGALRAKALELGLRDHPILEPLDADDALVRKYVFLANLKCVSQAALHALQVDTSRPWIISERMRYDPPRILESKEVRLDLALPFETPHTCTSFLHRCGVLFERMRNYWPPKLRPRVEDPLLRRKCDIAWWTGICDMQDCMDTSPTSGVQGSPWDSVKHFRRAEAAKGPTENAEVDIHHSAAVLPDDDWVSDFWRHHVIDAVSVHIDSRKGCVIAVPVAAQPLCDPVEPEELGEVRAPYDLTWLARLLARHTSDLLHATKEWQRLEAVLGGVLSDVDALHKYAEENFAEELVYVRACNSVRVAFTTILTATDSTREMSHVYCAMGLEKQHSFQQVVLGRFKDLSIGAHFLAAACDLLNVPFRKELLTVVGSMNMANQDKAKTSFLHTALSVCRVQMVETSHLNFDCDTFPTLIAGLTGVRSIVSTLRPLGDPSNMDFLDKLEDILRRPVRRREHLHEEQPVLEYSYEVPNAKTPPALILLPTSKWIGKLYLGPLSAAVSKTWLRWAGVTHVVCVLGKFNKEGGLVPAWEAAQKHRWKTFSYLDWPINSAAQRCYWREVFALLSDTLGSSRNAVLVHCRNGKDRSCFLVYAFLRLQHGLNHASALSCVSQRIDVRGYPLFDYASQNNQLLEWVDTSLGASLNADSGVMRWRAGWR